MNSGYTMYIQRGNMKTQLGMWGNSLAVRIPKPIAIAAELATGDDLEVDVEGPGRVRIQRPKSKPTIEELVSGITTENMHSETDWGEPVGKEMW
jgi:antitoxin MazE